MLTTCSRQQVCRRPRRRPVMQRLSARVSDDARRGWDRAATVHGCTFTALVEALGRGLAERDWDVPAEVADRARAIDRERFSRR